MSDMVIKKQVVWISVHVFEFSENSERILKMSSLESKYEIQWTATLAHYLLRELAVNPEFLLDKFSPKRGMLGPELEELVGKNFGDTSIGKA